MQSIVLSVKGGSAVTGDTVCVLRVCWQNDMQHLSEQVQFLGFLFPHVVQKQKLGEMGK